MAIDFPSSPTDGQKFTSGKALYTFSSALGAWSAAALGTALPFNYLLNPAMQVSQENGNTLVSGLTASASAYPADQWLLFVSCDPGAASTQRIQAVTPFGSANRIRSTVTTGTAVGSLQGDYLFQQKIEGSRVADLQWGTASAKQVILRFGFKAPAGTYGVAIRNAHPTATRTYLATFTIAAGQANIDTLQTLIIPGDTTGTWANDASLGLTVVVQMAGAGPFGNNGNAGWNAGNRGYILGQQTTGSKTAGLAYDLFDVGLYADPYKTGVAPPWESVPIGQAFLDCLRHWAKNQSFRGVSAGASNSRAGNQYIVDMRTGPAYARIGGVYAWDQGASSAVTTLTPYPNTHYAETEQNTAATMTAGRACFNPQDNNPAMYIATSARL
jgi:hypothetical protein